MTAKRNARVAVSRLFQEAACRDAVIACFAAAHRGYVLDVREAA
jgi:hypothetical protein